MTGREIIYDIKLLASKSGIPDDYRLGNRHVLFLANKHRGIGINTQYEALRETDPTWIQRFGLVHFTKVEFSDDPEITTVGSQQIGRWTAPSILAMRDDKGFVRVATISRHGRFFPVSFDRLMHIISTASLEPDTVLNVRASMRYTARLGNNIYVWPLDKTCANGIQVDLILDNPIDGDVILTSAVESGDIQEGVSYNVYNNQIVYNGATYAAGTSFVGVPGIFSYQGTGTIKLSIQKRKMTLDDNYPMSTTMATAVAMGVLTKELAVEESKIADIVNDAQDQLKTISSGK